MIKLIKGCELYSPEPQGKKDLLLAADKIAAVADQIPVTELDGFCQIIKAEGLLAVPGFIDNHVHILGGGGEGGFKTRTPEIRFSQLIESGITTVIGCLGTDGVCRDMKSLFAKASALSEEGLSSYLYTGSYQVPVHTLTGSLMQDIMLVEKVIGTGEIALSDHRSSQPTKEEITRIAAQSRIAGILSGKAGIVNLHMGNGERMLSTIETILQTTEIPATQFLPTHMNRNSNLLKKGIEYAKSGGYIDLTTSSSADHKEDGELSAAKSLKICLENGVPAENISFSSDGQGSLPIFDDNGKFLKLGIGSCSSLFEEVRKAVKEYELDLQESLKVITSNPANFLKLSFKGHLKPGLDADIVLLNKNDLTINSVIARGRLMMSDGELKVKGTFED